MESSPTLIVSYAFLSSKEIVAMYKDISRLGLLHFDMSGNNMVKAPENPVLPVCKSPGWTKPYDYRFVDFHRTSRTNLNKDLLYFAHIDRLGQLFGLDPEK